ncbi:MAG: hypothetical protein H6732_05800 [Alphaproteobacteria bacterium]|nr:hypothetical protein [Alphaproteobacteria bacterium]
MIALLDDLRVVLGPAPRRLADRDRRAFDVRIPDWLTEPDDPLREAVDRRGAILEQGEVTLGAVIMANDALRRGGTGSSVAEVLYTFDTALLRRTARFQQLAADLQAFREPGRPEATSPLTRDLRAALGTGHARNAHRRVPPHLVDGHLAWHATVLLDTSWLPGRRLVHDLLPLLVDRPDGEASGGHVAVIPAHFWPTWWGRTWLPPEEQAP